MYYPLVMSFSSALPFIVSYIFKCPRWSSVLKVREQNKKLKNNAFLLPELFPHQSIFQCLCCYVVKWVFNVGLKNPLFSTSKMVTLPNTCTFFFIFIKISQNLKISKRDY